MRLTRRETLSVAAGSALVPGASWAMPRPAHRLVHPRPSVEAAALYAYLWSIYGHRTLTGQQESGTTPAGPTAELDYLQQVTGRLPAILGLDYITPADQANVNERATAWHRSGGIVTLCWHWGAPDIGTGYENSKKDFDVPAALTPGTLQNRLMMDQMAHVADLLAVLRDRRVPVLWRPFHEFSGDWFWWGKHGPNAFKRLWVLMHDFYTQQRQLNNLIWVCGWAGQNVDPAYFPGFDRVDVAGADFYAADHGNQARMFAEVKAIVGDALPICMHENGPVPDPATLRRGAEWLWFMTWHTKWIRDPDQNTADQLRRFYGSSRYITKDELPKAWHHPAA